MEPIAFKFECPRCGEHLSGTPDQIGSSVRCPTCGHSFAVPSPPETRSTPIRHSQTPSRNPLLLPLIGVSALLILGLATASLLILRRSHHPAEITPSATPMTVAEVQRVREEVERLKSAQSSASPIATPATESPDYQNFLRVARRLMTTIESGSSFQDFHGRVADVLASAKEASRSAPTPAKQKAIATFATAIIDANDIWSCSGGDADGSLRYGKDKNGVVERYYGDFYHSCGRWDFELPKLVATYNLDTYELGYPSAYSANKSSWPAVTIRIDLALKKIFKVCADTFEILEASQSRPPQRLSIALPRTALGCRVALI